METLRAGVRVWLGWLVLWTATPAVADLPDTVARVKPSIVAIGTVLKTRRPPAKIIGTGFVVGNGKLVVTNAHVVPEEIDKAKHEALAIMQQGQGRKVRARRASLLASDREHDLALLEIEGDPLPALKLGDSEAVREGELYAFTGFPIGAALGLSPVTHHAIISAISPVAMPVTSTNDLDVKMIRRLKDPFEIFQLDAVAYPGNSGSPLYDPDTGAVVAVINAVYVKESKEKILVDPSGISYAMPVIYVRKLLKDVGM